MKNPALVVLLCAACTLILDGFDIQAAGFATPALVADLGVERAALGPALAASLVGMAIGAAGIGALGDRWGRRNSLILSTALFGAATLLAATATSVMTLALWRLITGIGLGGALTTATALIAEFAPSRYRSLAIGGIQVGVPVGGMTGAALAAELMPVHGWRSVFLVGGALPLLAAAVMYFVLPESPRFLAVRTQSAPKETIFSPQLRWDTAIVSLAFLTNMYAVYAFFSWAPLVLTSLGFELVTAVRGLFVFNLAGICGVIAISWLLSRLGSRRPLAVAAFAGAATLAALAWFAASSLSQGSAADGLPTLMSGIAVAGIAINAVQVGLYALAAHVFPTQCRTSGVGFSLGAGRTGGIVAALGGGALLTLSGAAGFFGWIAAALLIACVAILLVRRQIAARESYFAARASASGA